MFFFFFFRKNPLLFHSGTLDNIFSLRWNVNVIALYYLQHTVQQYCQGFLVYCLNSLLRLVLLACRPWEWLERSSVFDLWLLVLYCIFSLGSSLFIQCRTRLVCHWRCRIVLDKLRFFSIRLFDKCIHNEWINILISSLFVFQIWMWQLQNGQVCTLLHMM